MTVTHTSETITPDLAQKYLDRNKHNRPVKSWHVRLLSQDMTAGRFPENGENGITFDWNNNIAGGQHTLLAIVDSGCTVQLRVTRGVDPATRSTMNDSMKQRFYDDLTVSGVSNATFAEPLLRKVIIWETVARENKGQGGLKAWRNARMSRATLSSEWPTYAAGITATISESMKYFDAYPGNRGAMQLLWWVLTEKYGFSKTITGEFLDRICYGSSEPAESALFHKLRVRLAKDSKAEHQVYWVMRIWNAWTTGERLSKLQAPQGGITDPYPRLRRPR